MKGCLIVRVADETGHLFSALKAVCTDRRNSQGAITIILLYKHVKTQCRRNEINKNKIINIPN